MNLKLINLSLISIFTIFSLSLFAYYPQNNSDTRFPDISSDTLTSNPDTVGVIDFFPGSDSTLTFSRLNEKKVADNILKTSPIADMLDSLANIRFFTDDYFTTDTTILNIYRYAPWDVPAFSDSVYEARISALARQTPFELGYNKTVKNFIELYAVRKRNLTSRILGLAEIYFPLFEEMLDRYKLPIELKYLAVIESALNPVAGSHAGAKGLWQFMYGTGKLYGLGVTSYVDDRFDPYKSTIAACRHLQDLYEIYGDWSLVLAAYNSGAGNVNKAIRRAGGVRSYWAIWPYLPAETRGYVPAFIAVNYVMNYAREHNLYPVDPGILYNGIDTVQIRDVLSFEQVSEFLNIPIEDIRFLNPSYKLGIIPATSQTSYTLRLPRQNTGDFITNEKEIYAYKTQKGIEREKLLAQMKEVKEQKVHKVRKGESLGLIARKYHTSVSNLKKWNKLKSNEIHPGQKLVIYDSSPSQPEPAITKKTEDPKSEVKVTESNLKPADTVMYHIVKSGENLGLIAKKYHCTIADLQKWNNLNSTNIQPKQKLLVHATQEVKNPTTEAVQNNQNQVKYIYHIVKPGDTLWDIAKQYDGATVNEIKRLNKLSNNTKIKPGQKLKVAIAG